MIFTSTELVCPSGTPGAAPIVIDLEAIRKSEVRQQEVATINLTKAPELLSEFNRSWRETNQLVVQLRSEKMKAERAMDRREAELMLGAADVLKEKKLSSSADLREAVVALDAGFQALQNTFDEIEAAVEFLRGKATSFENAYTSVKKILQADHFPPGPNQNLSGDTAAPVKAGFGKPRY